MTDDNIDSDISYSSHSAHSAISTSSSLYIEMVPFNLRGRAEWWELRRDEIKINEKLAEGSNGIITPTEKKNETRIFIFYIS